MYSLSARIWPFINVRRLFCSAGFKIQFRIKGEELEEVAMGFAGRGAGPTITHFPKVIASLGRTVRQLTRFGNILREGA